MYLPEQIYTWLVEVNIITNQGQIDQKGNVTLLPQQAANLDNGFIVGQVTRRIATLTTGKIPNALATVKSDSAKNTKLTNWNFIWLAFETINLKLDTRIKQLILQGEHALIVEVLRQLHERDPQKKQNSKIVIRQKQNGKQKVGSSQAVDIKKINLNKDPEESESSLQFLILLIKTSLGMNLEEILGLFTNQNKYLAHLLVKGLNDNFDPIILFYSLLNKHALKLKHFHDQDPRDAESCLYALKPGFISKSQKVAELALDLFGKLGNIYQWFISEDSKCSGTFLLGVKRHQALRQLYWHLLVQIIEGEELQFFTKHYSNSFQNPAELIEVTTYLLKHIAVSFLGEKITNIGIAASWLETSMVLPETDIEAQSIAINFVGELMIYLPAVIEQNEQCLIILTRNWQKRSIGQFVTLFNQLIGVLQKLGETKSSMVDKIYDIIALIAKVVGPGDKRDYLVQIFVPLISKFASLPSEHLIQHLKRVTLSSSQYLLVCESIQITQDTVTLIKVGNFLKQIFLENPLLNFFVLSLIKQITQRVMKDTQKGNGFIQTLLQDTLHQYSLTEIKYKPRPKQQKSMYFGKSGSPEKVSKQNQEELLIKQKWKDLYLGLIRRLTDLAFSQQNDQFRQIIKQKLMNANSYIRLNNHKIGSKQLEDLLNRRFEITKDQQIQHSEQYKQKIVNNMEQSMIRKSKVTSQFSLGNKLKGPQNLIKEFQSMVQKRKQEEQGRQALQIKKQLIQQKKKMNVKKELQITNLLRGQIGQAQLREEGFLQRLMQQPNQNQLIPLDQLQQRDLDAIEAIFKKYHRAMRHLFLLYTGTMYSSHTAEVIEDNQRRKQILTTVQLGKFLKEYGFFFLTSQPEINNMVRDINVKLLNRRQVNQLDFTGFQQYIIQFCYHNMTRQHTVTTSAGKFGENVVSVDKQLKGQPIYVILKQFFAELKKSFIAKKEKLSVFEDIQDIPLSKEQAYAVQILNQKLSSSSSYILPKGYKKVVQKSVQFKHFFSPMNYGLQQAYEIAFDAMDYILSKSSLKIHVFQSMAQKITTYKVKPTSLGFSDFQPPRQRAMSTVIDSKSPLLPDINKNRGSSKGLLTALKPYPSQSSKGLTQGNQIPTNSKEKQAVKQKKALSLAKLSEIQKAKFEQMAKKAKQKEFERQEQIQRQKQKQRKRRQQNQRFMEQRKAKLMEKKKKQQEQRQRKFHQQQQKQAQIRQNKQKFKVFHQGQLERIKKIEIDAGEKIRREKEEETQQKERLQEQRRRLREQIEEEDKKMIQSRKEVEKKLNSIYQSQAIKRIFVTYKQNLQAIFQFLISRTHISLTQKKLNNQIIFDTWRYFLNVFEISPLILNPKDVVFIFKTITKDKIAPKQYNVGLSFQEFEQALLRIAIKHKSIFNLISKKIKDKITQEKQIPAAENDKIKKSAKKEGKQSKSQLNLQKAKPNSKILQKQINQFEKTDQINIKELMKQDSAGIDDIDYYGDLSKVSEKTLRGLIFYLKVPNSKVGQQQRFRSLLLQKPKASIQNSQKLKEKLSEEYTLQSPVKKLTTKSVAQSNSNPIATNPALNEPIRSYN